MSKRVLLCGLLLAVAAVAAQADDWNKTFSTPHPQIKLNTDDASVIVTSCECKEVTARVSTIGYRIAPDEVRISEQQAGDAITLEVRVPNMHFSWGRHSVEVSLTVPRTSDLNLHTGDGHIQVTSVTGDLRFETGDGHVTGNGLDGKLHVHTGDGHITVGGRFDALELETNDGHVEADIRPGSKNGAGWRVHTGDGSVTLRLPSNFSADLDAHTGDGHIDVELPVTTSGAMDKTHIRGKLNQGGAPLTITTGDGSIRLQRGMI